MLVAMCFSKLLQILATLFRWSVEFSEILHSRQNSRHVMSKNKGILIEIHGGLDQQFSPKGKEAVTKGRKLKD